MPAAFVQQATHISQTGDQASATTAAITTTVGNLIVLMGSFWRSGGSDISYSDSKGNTWNTGINIVSGATNELEGRAFIASCILVNAGSGHTFTATQNASTAYMEFDAVEFSGIMASPLDKTADDHGGSGDTACSATTAALSQADELAIAVLFSGVNDSSISISHPPSGFTGIGTTTYPGGGVYKAGASSGYKIVSNGAAQNAAWTFGSGGAISENAGVIATYKATAAGGPLIVESGMRIPSQMLEGEDVFQAEVLSLKAWF